MKHDGHWRTAGKQLEILILEDNPGDVRLLDAELRGEGLADVHLTVAPRLSDGLHLLASRGFDAVLLDLNLPDSQGMESFERLRAAAPELPLVVYTEAHDNEIAVRTLRGGAQDYIVKGPGVGPLLARAVYFAIERHNVRVELDLRAARLEKSRFTLRRIVEASPDVIVILDRSGAVRFVNGGAESAYGRSAADLVGLIPALQPGAQEVNFAHPDGSVRTAEVSVVEIDWEGEPAAMVSLHDVTERKRAQEQVEAQNARLEASVHERTAELIAANSELEAFAHSVSHDLRAPLRHIKGFTQILAEEAGGTLSPSSLALLDRIQVSADRMQNLIEDLLVFARLGHSEISRQAVALGALVDEVIEELAPEAKGRPVEWRVAAGLPCVDADESMLRIVLVNLLSNALKFSRGRNPARIEVFAAGGHTAPVIAVRDNGAGFAAEHAGKLFAGFQRLHSQEEFEGTGVGLATVKRIVTRHGGRVWAEAEPGKGATFYFSLGPAAA